MSKTTNPEREQEIRELERPRGWREVPRGGLILTAGNAVHYKTGDWRSFRPIWDEKKCIDCLRCWVYCPEGAILTEDGEVRGINLEHCKGCGICVEECPDKVQALEMINEGSDEDEDDPDK